MMIVEKAGRAMSWSVVAKVARFVAMPLSYVVIVRALGEHDWGVLSVLRTVTGFALVVIMLGGGRAALRYIPEVRVRGGMRELLSAMGRLGILQATAWALLTAAAYLFGERISHFFHQDPSVFVRFLVIALGLVLFEAGMALTMNLLQSWYETRRMAFVMIIGNAVYVTLLILFMRWNLGIAGVLAAGGAVNLMMILLLVPEVVVLMRRPPAEDSPGPGVTRMLKYSLPFVATGLLNQIIWRHSEVLFLGHYTGMEAAGYFGLAYRIPQMTLEFIPLSIWPIVMAGISERYAENPGRLGESIDLYFRLLFLLIVPVAAMGIAFSEPLVPLLFGQQMQPAASMTRLFFIVFSYSFLYTPLSMALYVMEKSWVNMLVFTALAIVNIGLDLALIPRFGLWGAFFPVSAVMLLGIAAFRFVAGRYDPELSIPVGFIGRCCLAGLPTALLGISASRWNSPVALAVQMVIGVFFIFTGLKLLKVFGDREKELMLRLPIPMKERIVSIL
jgi:O-antigen/teichoic acid export membrane protein